jgi:hypothetical protein
MDRSEFINNHLNPGKYSWREIDGKIVINSSKYIALECLTIPEGVVFDNSSGIKFDFLNEIPEGTIFLNRNSIFFQKRLKSIGKGTKFNNWNDLVFNGGIEKIGENVIFENNGDISYGILSGGNIGGLSKGVKFNNGGSVGTAELNLSVDGISNKRVLNCMIKQLYGE